MKDSVVWFRSGKAPDLIFLDIHLEDDLSFAIFREVSILCHIVFTTATDELATSAFKLKKIDFLLKPIIQKDLNAMIVKYARMDKPIKPIDPDIFNDIVNNR